MPDIPNFEKLEKQIQKFLVIYKILTPEAKGAFEAQMNANFKGMDDRTKRLTQALFQAAKDGDNKNEAIEALNQVNKDISGGV